MNPLRVGMIGCGKIARRHAAAIRQTPELELVAFYDHTLANAVAAVEDYGAGAAYDALVPMLDAQHLDVAYISLPPFAHTNEVPLLCARGIHFLIEKPIALTLDKAGEMVRAVEASGVTTQVGFMYRQGIAVQHVRAYLDQHPTPGFMVGRYACNSLHRPWWRDRTRGGGQVLEQIIHLLDLSRYLFGQAEAVVSMQANLFHRAVPDYTVEDASGTLVRFANGSLAVIAANNSAIPGRWESDWRVVLPALTVDFTNANRAVLHQTDVTPVTDTLVESDTDLFYLQSLDLVRAIRDHTPTRAPIQEGYTSLALALGAMRSAAEPNPPTITL